MYYTIKITIPINQNEMEHLLFSYYFLYNSYMDNEVTGMCVLISFPHPIYDALCNGSMIVPNNGNYFYTCIAWISKHFLLVQRKNPFSFSVDAANLVMLIPFPKNTTHIYVFFFVLMLFSYTPMFLVRHVCDIYMMYERIEMR